MSKLAKVLPMTYLCATMPMPEINKGITCYYPCTNAIGWVYRKSTPGQLITIRTRLQRKDHALMRKWLAEELAYPKKTKKLNRFLRDSYRYIYQYDMVKSFLLCENGTPLGFLDIIEATQHEVSLYYQAKIGDYNIDLLLSPSSRNESALFLKVLIALMEFIFMAPIGVARIVIAAEKVSYCADWIQKAGFCFLESSVKQSSNTNLFICTRDSFQTILLPSYEGSRTTEIQFDVKLESFTP